MDIKKTVLAATVAAFAASPAYAQMTQAQAVEPMPPATAGQAGPYAAQPDLQAPSIPLAPTDAPRADEQPTAYGAFGPAQGQFGTPLQPFAGSPGSDVVISRGEVIGQDPDPSIRAEMRRNADRYLGESG